VVYAEINALFKELAPDFVVRNIVDDSILQEVIASGGVTDAVRKRIETYYQLAEQTGADLILNQCSSVREAARSTARLVKVPVVNIDERMAEVACQTGKRIGVIATLPTTLDPTCRLIQATAGEMGKEIEVIPRLCVGAFEKLIAGDRAVHNQMVISAIRELMCAVDVIVCAQASMEALLPELGSVPVPVLTSLRLGVEKVIQVLAGR